MKRPHRPCPQVARLFLLNDILHNSSAPVRNASAYRTHFQARLPDIFESVGDTLKAVAGRISAEAMKKHVLCVLRCWGDWFLFSEAFLQGLQATFLRGRQPDGLLPHHPLRQQLQQLPLEDLERRCRHSGLSTRGGAEACICRVLARWPLPPLSPVPNPAGDALAALPAPHRGALLPPATLRCVALRCAALRCAALWR